MNRSFRYACLTLGLLLVYLCTAFAADPKYDTDAVLGIWATEPNDDGAYSHVEIYPEDGKYNGRIVWLSSPVYEADEADED